MKFKIVFGTYERFLYGLECDEYSVTPVFMYPAHLSCVKAVALSPTKFLATGSTDEQVKLYDISSRKEIGLLSHHSASITHLKFYKTTHLFTSAEDGAIGIVRTKDWELLKLLTGHKGPVNWFDVHESGKVLLSVGKDMTAKVWDLTKGLCIYSMKLKREAERVVWTKNGSIYVLLMDREVNIYDVSSEGVLKGTFSSLKRITCIITHTHDSADIIISGNEDRTISIHSIAGELMLTFHSNHTSRIKDISAIAGTGESPAFLISGDSEGKVFIWNLSEILQKSGSPNVEKIGMFDGNCRLTCIDASWISEKKDKKRRENSDGLNALNGITEDNEDEEEVEENDDIQTSERLKLSEKTSGAKGNKNVKITPKSEKLVRQTEKKQKKIKSQRTDGKFLDKKAIVKKAPKKTEKKNGKKLGKQPK